jgi:hypothetical protein
MKRRALFALLLLAAVAPTDAAGKGVTTVVVVGADGRSVRTEPEEAVLSVMFYNPATA